MISKLSEKLKPHQIEKLIKHDFKPDENEHYIEKLLHILKPQLESFVYEDPLKVSNIYSRYLLSQQEPKHSVEPKPIAKQKQPQTTFKAPVLNKEN